METLLLDNQSLSIYGSTEMTSQDNLRDRIETILDRFTGESWEHHHRDAAQAIIDEFDLTVRGDDCGYHEIHGSYDTSFEEREQR